MVEITGVFNGALAIAVECTGVVADPNSLSFQPAMAVPFV